MSTIPSLTRLITSFLLLFAFGAQAYADEVVVYRDAEGNVHGVQATEVETVLDDDGAVKHLNITLQDGSTISVNPDKLISRRKVKAQPAVDETKPDADQGKGDASSDAESESGDPQPAAGESETFKAEVLGGITLTIPPTSTGVRQADDPRVGVRGYFPLADGAWWEVKGGKETVISSVTREDGSQAFELRRSKDFSTQTIVVLDYEGYTFYAVENEGAAGKSYGLLLVEPMEVGMAWEDASGMRTAVESVDESHTDAAGVEHPSCVKLKQWMPRFGDERANYVYYANGLGKVSHGFMAFHPAPVKEETSEPSDPEGADPKTDAPEKVEPKADEDATPSDPVSPVAPTETSEGTEPEGVAPPEDQPEEQPQDPAPVDPEATYPKDPAPIEPAPVEPAPVEPARADPAPVQPVQPDSAEDSTAPESQPETQPEAVETPDAKPEQPDAQPALPPADPNKPSIEAKPAPAKSDSKGKIETSDEAPKDAPPSEVTPKDKAPKDSAPKNKPAKADTPNEQKPEKAEAKVKAPSPSGDQYEPLSKGDAYQPAR